MKPKWPDFVLCHVKKTYSNLSLFPTDAAMTLSTSTEKILEEILEYLPVLIVPPKERLLLKDCAFFS